MKKTPSPSKAPPNPMVWPLAISTFVTLGVAGVTLLLDVQGPLDWLFVPLALACFLSLLAYTFIAIRLGWIASIGHLGRVHHYERRKSPVAFWLLVMLYLIVAIPAAAYLAGEVIPMML